MGEPSWCNTRLPSARPDLQLEEQVEAFLQEAALRSVAASGGSSDGEAAELPLVEHAAGFERYKVAYCWTAGPPCHPVALPLPCCWAAGLPLSWSAKRGLGRVLPDRSRLPPSSCDQLG